MLKKKFQIFFDNLHDTIQHILTNFYFLGLYPAYLVGQVQETRGC